VQKTTIVYRVSKQRTLWAKRAYKTSSINAWEPQFLWETEARNMRNHNNCKHAGACSALPV